MGFNLGDIFVTFKAKTDSLKRGLNTVQTGIGKLGSFMGKTFKAAAAASKTLVIGFMAMGAAATVFGKKSIDAYNASIEAQTKLRTNLLNVKGATMQHVQALQNQAAALQAVGVIEDDVIVAGQSQLATFNLQGKTIEKLTPKIADMVAQLKGHNATSEDMVGINNLVGKVMTGNVGALSRYGVTLDETQAKVLQNGNESQRAAMLVKVLGQNYGEVNKELRNTPQGKITALKNSFGDLQEGVGEFLVEAISPLVGLLGRFVKRMDEAGGMLNYFKKLIKENKQVVMGIVGAVAGALVPGIVALGIAFVTAFAPLVPFIALGALVAMKFREMSAAAKGLWQWFTNLNPAVQLLINPIGAIVAHFKTLVSWGQALANLFMKFLWPSIKALGMTLFKDLAPALRQVWDAVLRLWNALQPGLVTVLKIIGAFIGVTLVGALWLLINVLKIAVAGFAGIVSAISNVIKWISNLIGWLGNIPGAAMRAYQGTVAWFKRLPGYISDIIGAIVEWFAKLPGRIGKALSPIKDKIIAPFKSAFDWITNAVGKVKDVVSKLNPGNVAKSLGSKIKNLIPGFASGIENFGGGLAYVHGGEVLTNLPKGTNVVPKNKVAQMGIGGVGSAGGDVYNLHVEGVLASGRQELRKAGMIILEAIDEERRAQGKRQLLGDK